MELEAFLEYNQQDWNFFGTVTVIYFRIADYNPVIGIDYDRRALSFLHYFMAKIGAY